MRKFAYGLLGFFLVVVPQSQIYAADAEKSSPIKLDANLVDGSKIKGELPPPYRPFEVVSAELGRLSVPLAKITVINFNTNHTEATLHLSNGDKLQGRLGLDSLKMTTLFGAINLPFSVVKELQFHSFEAGDGDGLIVPEDWDLLPFPQDSDWPGNRGAPPRFENGEVIVQGAQDARSRKLYSTPLTVECDVVLEARASQQGAFRLRFVAEGQPRDLDAKQFVSLELAYRQNRPDQLIIVQRPATRQDQVLADMPVHAGRAYHIRIHLQPDHWQVTLNDETYEIDGISMPSDRFYIQLYGWEPADRWHVSHLKAY